MPGVMAPGMAASQPGGATDAYGINPQRYMLTTVAEVNKPVEKMLVDWDRNVA
jgi:hypothetical protein